MKYLGEKSLSSAMYRFLLISWYLVIIGVVFLGFVFSIGMFSHPVTGPAETVFDKFKVELFNEIKKDDKAWEFFTAAPVAFKIMGLIYMGGVVLLILSIIKKGQHIFNNFKVNLVFDKSNVHIITTISKLLVAFSIMTFNFSSFLVSIILLVLTDVFKNGAALQEEHDLTV